MGLSEAHQGVWTADRGTGKEPDAPADGLHLESGRSNVLDSFTVGKATGPGRGGCFVKSRGPLH